MARKPYTVELYPGRREPATRQRLYQFQRYVMRTLDGDISDTWVYPQSSGYVRCMAQVWVADEHLEALENHPSVMSVTVPPKVAW